MAQAGGGQGTVAIRVFVSSHGEWGKPSSRLGLSGAGCAPGCCPSSLGLWVRCLFSVNR